MTLIYSSSQSKFRQTVLEILMKSISFKFLYGLTTFLRVSQLSMHRIFPIPTALSDYFVRENLPPPLKVKRAFEIHLKSQSAFFFNPLVYRLISNGRQQMVLLCLKQLDDVMQPNTTLDHDDFGCLWLKLSELEYSLTKLLWPKSTSSLMRVAHLNHGTQSVLPFEKVVHRQWLGQL